MTAPTPSKESTGQPGVAYLFSRYPVASQTFCDREMLAHEAAGFPLLVVSLNPPATLFRHDHFSRLAAEIVYPPAAGISADSHVPSEIAAAAEELERRFGTRFNLPQRARNAAHFAGVLKGRGIRHCHVHFANQATITALLMRPVGISFSFTAHGQDFTTDLGEDGMLQALAKEAEFVVGVSESACQLLREKCPGNEAKIHRIYNGIDLDGFPMADPGSPGLLQILSIGRLVEFKGFAPLVKACGQLRDRGRDFHLTIVGEGPLRDELEKQILALGLASQITLAGLLPIEKIRGLLAGSHVFALGSIVDSQGTSDTLPTVIAEAMACGLPVVSTRLAGIPEMVDEEKTGLLVEPGDAAALADALGRLASDPAARQAMGLAGREKAAQSFDVASCTIQLREHLAPFAAGKAGHDILCLTTEDAPEEIALLAGSTRVVHLGRDLPEASVLEAEWLAQTDHRDRIEQIRTTLPRKFQGHDFYLAARQAIHLARLVEARRIRCLHAVRGDSALVVYLLSHLTGVPATATIEPDPAPPRPLLRAILPSFAATNLADPTLAGESLFADQEKHRDFLQLSPREKKRMRIGPFKFTVSASAAPVEDPRGKALLRKLREIADA